MSSDLSAPPAGPADPGVSGADAVALGKLTRENNYLKLRCAQLQDDVTDLSGQLARARQELERLLGQRAARAGSPGGA